MGVATKRPVRGEHVVVVVGTFVVAFAGLVVFFGRHPLLYDTDSYYHLIETLAPPTTMLELAPWGPSRLWLDDRLLAATDDDLEAVLGRGIVVEIEATAAPRLLTVVTCVGRQRPDQRGFYLRRLAGASILNHL